MQNTQMLLAVVLSKTEDGFYKLGTETSILKQLYAKSEFSVCKERFFNERRCPYCRIIFMSNSNKTVPWYWAEFQRM